MEDHGKTSTAPASTQLAQCASAASRWSSAPALHPPLELRDPDLDSGGDGPDPTRTGITSSQSVPRNLRARRARSRAEGPEDKAKMSAIPDRELDIQINQIAQGFKPAAELRAAFDLMSDGERRSVLRRINALSLQAGAMDADVPDAIKRSGVRPGRTSAALLSKGRIGLQLAKVATLPSSELDDALRLTITLLEIADARRRQERCARGCRHWWHRDLSDELVLARVRSGDLR